MRPSSGVTAVEEDARRLTVLLVEDYRIFADLLADRMRAEARVAGVEVACSLNEARANLRRSRPDLILLDLNLGGEAGLDLFADLDRMTDPPRVLMLSGIDSVEQVVRAFGAGADGWVSKTAPFETLMFAVHEVVTGNMYLAPHSLGPVLRHLLRSTKEDETFIDTVSERQLDVLRCMVAGMSRTECAERLHVSVNTVRTHVQQLLKRADVHSTLALASLARELGVRGIDEASPEVSALRPRSSK
jgi:DNA-binding NarL/FixJ family response regulator